MAQRRHAHGARRSKKPRSLKGSVRDVTATSASGLASGAIPSKDTVDSESHASASLSSTHVHKDQNSTFPFLNLPAELRVRIYRYILHAHSHVWISKPNTTRGYSVDIVGILYPAVLSVNRQLYLEASRVLYSENRFIFLAFAHDYFFGIIATIISFLDDHSPGSRRLIRQIEYSYPSRFFTPNHRQCWNRVLAGTYDYLRQNLQMKQLTLSLFDSSDPTRDHLADINKRSWTQELPLGENPQDFQIDSTL